MCLALYHIFDFDICHYVVNGLEASQVSIGYCDPEMVFDGGNEFYQHERVDACHCLERHVSGDFVHRSLDIVLEYVQYVCLYIHVYIVIMPSPEHFSGRVDLLIFLVDVFSYSVSGSSTYSIFL